MIETEDIDYKVLDRQCLLYYLSGRNEVTVQELKARSVVNRLRLYPLILELSRSGVIQVLTTDEFGAPTTIRIVK